MKKTKLLSLTLSAIMAMSIFVGCTDSESKEEGKKDEKPAVTTMVDREGTEFTIPENMDKILSTAPSNTEVLMELGLGDKLVGIDTYSADIEGINPELPQIDFSNPDAEAIIAMEPDIIIASGHNRVDEEDPFALVKEAGIQIVYIPSSTSIQGVYDDIKFISEVTGTEEKGTEIVEAMEKEVAAVKEIAKTITEEKSVYFEIGAYGDLYTFGNETFLNEMIELIGAKNIFGDEPSWITTTQEAVLAANPDVILVNSAEYEPGKSAVEDVKSREGWDTITAVKDDAVYFINQNASSRPSQNIIVALKEMAKAIYPDAYKGL